MNEDQLNALYVELQNAIAVRMQEFSDETGISIGEFHSQIPELLELIAINYREL